nr:uncharacterized mitochondrial protein AtMg00810-like [Tanacetum cinerariifolium]
DDENATNPPPVPPTPQAPHTLSTIKLPILKKEMWDAIKSGFDENDKSKKIQKYILKQQFEGFYVSPLKIPIRSFLGLYLLHGPKLGVDTLSFDDLYNNLRVFESNVKGSTASSSSTQNVAFVSSDSTNSTNESLKEKTGEEKLNGDAGSKTNKEPVHQEDQAFLEELERLKRQENEANDAAGTLRKTTPINTASTPVNAASTPVNIATPSRHVIDPKFLKKVYKVVKALYGLHQAPRAWFQMSSMGELTFFLVLQVKQKEDRIFVSQDKYVAEILKKFDFMSVKTASTPVKTNKPLVKDEEASDVDAHLYRSMIDSLIYLTASRPDIITMASAIICLATNQKFNFSRYILLILVKNLEAGVPFFMFPRFVQLIINHQLGDMTHHKEIFDIPSLTKKVFTNMKRVGTGFSRKVTPLFANMFVQAPEKYTKKPKVPHTESPVKHNLPSPSHDPLPSGDDILKLKELMDFCTNLSNKVLDLESEVIGINYTYQARIEKLESRVERLEEKNRVLKELKVVHSTVDSDEPVMEKERSSKQERKIADIDADVEINLEKAQAMSYNFDLDHQEKVLIMMDVNDEEPADVEKVLKVVKAANLITEVVTTAGETKVNVPRKRRDEVNEGVKVPEKEVRQEKEVEVESSKREGESLKQEIAKKQKMEQETEELKKHLQIVSDDDDDDVYIDATPLASKIHIERNRPYFKIIRADGNHMLFMNDYLLNTLKIMVEKPNVEASVWKDQKGKYGLVKIKSWKLIESCGVHCLTLLNTHIFILVERMYPLTYFTLEQMINDVRLEVVDKSEMSLELLRLVRRQLNEGSYVGGHASSVNVYDTDEFCLHDLKDMVVKLEMASYMKDYKIILVYVEHESSIFVTPKKEVSIAVDNHLRKGPIEIDTSPDVNRNLTPMCHKNLTKEWEHVRSKSLSIGNSSTVNDLLDLEILFKTNGVGLVRKFKEVEVDTNNESEEESDTEGDYTSGSDSKDSNYDLKHDEVFDDDEHILEDVHVSTNNFCFTVDPKHDISIGAVEVQEDDLDVIDYDSFGSDLDDGIDSERRIQLRELRRICKHKNKERMRVSCEGTIPALVLYVATENDMGNEFLQTKGGPINRENNNSGKQNILGKDKTCQGKGRKLNKQKKVVKYSCPWTMLIAYTNECRWEVKTLIEDHNWLQSREIKACTSWFLSDHIIKSLATNLGIPVRAVQDQMHKQFDVGAHVYLFKVNPCNDREMWPVVKATTVRVLPLYKPQVGRPPKKRKKSHYEIANKICLSGKLSRKGKSVRCSKCGNVGHNMKGYRGQGGTTQAGGSSARNVSS